MGTEKLEAGDQLNMSILVTEGTGEPWVTTGSPVTEVHAAPPIRNLWDGGGQDHPLESSPSGWCRENLGFNMALALPLCHCVALGQ